MRMLPVIMCASAVLGYAMCVFTACSRCVCVCAGVAHMLPQTPTHKARFSGMLRCSATTADMFNEKAVVDSWPGFECKLGA